MKTKFFYFFAIALLSGLTVFVSSCSKDDDEIDNNEEQTEQSYIDDIDFVRKRLVSLDANGNFNGLLCGVYIDESRPTTAFVSVENLNEAKELWNSLIPYDAKAVANGDNELVELTDENGTKQGDMRFNVLSSGNELAEIVFSSSKLIDARLSQLVFIPSNFWPNNDGGYEGYTPVIMTRKGTDTKYAVIKMPNTTGKAGYIIHVGEKRYIIDREHQKGTGMLMRYFPSTSSMAVISNTIKSNPNLWEVLSQVSGVSVEELKTSRFFLSRADQRFDYVFDISQVLETFTVPLPFNWISQIRDDNAPGFWNYTSRVYIMTLQDGVIHLTMDNNFIPGKIPDDVVNELNLTMDDFELE